jgi:hypothetical protein
MKIGFSSPYVACKDMGNSRENNDAYLVIPA